MADAIARLETLRNKIDTMLNLQYRLPQTDTEEYTYPYANLDEALDDKEYAFKEAVRKDMKRLDKRLGGGKSAFFGAGKVSRTLKEHEGVVGKAGRGFLSKKKNRGSALKRLGQEGLLK